MNINVRTVYAMIALGEIANCKDGKPVKAGEIAVKYEIPPRFLELTLNDLKTKGVIGSKRGTSGGFYLTKHPDKITLLDIIKVTEANDKIFDCDTIPNKNMCFFNSIFDELNLLVTNFLDKITLSQIASKLYERETSDFII